MSGHDDGREQRKDVREPVTLVVEYEGADDLLGDYTENLSNGGTFVATNRELPIGTAVQLVLGFPGLLEPIRIDGTVKWTENITPYLFNGDASGTLDTTTLSNGAHTLALQAHAADGRTATTSSAVTVANGPATAPATFGVTSASPTAPR
jgi:Tfp pilus assembly protein PilZ